MTENRNPGWNFYMFHGFVLKAIVVHHQSAQGIGHQKFAHCRQLQLQDLLSIELRDYQQGAIVALV